MKILFNTINFFIGGIIAGTIAFGFLTIVPFSTDFSWEYINMGIISFIEEFIRLLVIWQLIGLINYRISIKKNILFAISTGFGFSIFELFLIQLNASIFLNSYFLFNTTLHIVNSFLLIMFTTHWYHQKRKLSTEIMSYLALALFIHLCYNLIVNIGYTI